MDKEPRINVHVAPKDPLDDDFIRHYTLKSKYVSDGIGNEFRNWTSQTPVVISSQTGTGKNTFIENILLSYVKDHNKKILIISNRIAVNRQSKIRIAKISGCEQCLNELTDIGLDKKEFWGNVMIVSYQKLNSYFDDETLINLNDFFIIIFDEFHFFISDSLYNNLTGKILSDSLKFFKNSIRIYLSATPYEVLPILIDKEKLSVYSFKNYMRNTNYFPFNKPPQMLYYDFIRNYKYLNIRYFDDKKSVSKFISMTDHESKTIIFVSSKKDGEDFAKEIEKDAVFIDATSKNSKNRDGEIYNEIVTTETFSCDVLISTSVLDNGINIKDTLVRNIFIFSYDKTQFMQMLGRKRVLEGEILNLYLYSSNIKEFKQNLYFVNNQFKLISQFKNNPTLFLNQLFKNSDLFDGLLYFDKNSKPLINGLAKTKLNNLKSFYEKMCNNFTLIGREVFILEQLSWLGLKKTYNPNLWLNQLETDENKKKFIDFLDYHCNINLSGAALENFQKEFTQLFITAYGKQPGDRSDRVYKETKMRKVLNLYKLDYEIKIKETTFTLYKK